MRGESKRQWGRGSRQEKRGRQCIAEQRQNPVQRRQQNQNPSRGRVRQCSNPGKR